MWFTASLPAVSEDRTWSASLWFAAIAPAFSEDRTWSVSLWFVAILPALSCVLMVMSDLLGPS